MASSLFITGCRGFVGSHLLRAIDPSNFGNIYCLSRMAPAGDNRLKSGRFQWIKASLHETKAYSPSLGSSEIVIHLAAATGKAKPEEYFHVNSDGTQRLIEQCKHQGVKKFLYISSIAVKFPEKSHYYYAQSKEKAEHLVRNSGLNYTIIRPTIVLGKESAIWKRLSQLSYGPIILLFGDGTTKIQPVYVDDLVTVLLSLVGEGIFFNETFDLGGPEVITIENFLERIHQKYHDRRARVIHLPLRQILPALSFVERYASPLMPFNTGQLATFANDGTAEPNLLAKRVHPMMKNVDTMLALLTSNQ